MKRNEDEDVEKEIKATARTAYDAQRARLERLMKDPSKPAYIGQPRKEKDVNKAPDFVYNVMGSSAGAGSGEFHVYRQIRRKEYERQRVLESRKGKEDKEEEFRLKREENAREAEEKTAKKRAKRQKKKQNAKRNKLNRAKNPKPVGGTKEDTSESEDSEAEEPKEGQKSDDKQKEAQKSEDKQEEAQIPEETEEAKTE